MCAHSLTHVQLFATPWTTAYQAPLSMRFSRQEYLTGFYHFLLQGSFLTQGSNPCLLHLLDWQVDSLPLKHLGSPTSLGGQCPKSGLILGSGSRGAQELQNTSSADSHLESNAVAMLPPPWLCCHKCYPKTFLKSLLRKKIFLRNNFE